MSECQRASLARCFTVAAASGWKSFFEGEGGDVADLGVADAEFGGVVEDGVDVEGGDGGFVGELAEAVDEVFLEGVGEVVLGAEEDYTALGDWEGLG